MKVRLILAITLPLALVVATLLVDSYYGVTHASVPDDRLYAVIDGRQVDLVEGNIVPGGQAQVASVPTGAIGNTGTQSATGGAASITGGGTSLTGVASNEVLCNMPEISLIAEGAQEVRASEIQLRITDDCGISIVKATWVENPPSANDHSDDD